MRELKFRAWNPHDKELCEVYTISKTYVNYITDVTEKESMCRVPIDEIILMQFTGLLDKNGVEIYEGDIVHQPFIEWVCVEAIGTIVFKDGKFLFKDNAGKTAFSIQSNVEVLGNIYENSELLK